VSARGREDRGRAAALGAFVALLGACVDDPSGAGPTCRPAPIGDRFALVHASLWEVVGAEDDPWAAHRPAGLACAPDSAQPEDFAGQLTFGVDTSACGHATARQALLQDACAGEQAFVWVWREALTGPEGTTSTLAVRVGDEVLWERRTPIPAPPELIAITAELGADHMQGEPIWFHVRNHGSNSYQLIELSRCVGACTVPP